MAHCASRCILVVPGFIPPFGYPGNDIWTACYWANWHFRGKLWALCNLTRRRDACYGVQSIVGLICTLATVFFVTIQTILFSRKFEKHR